MQVKITAKAYISKYAMLEDVVSGRQAPLIITESHGFFESQGYHEIGDATVTIELHTEDRIMTAKMEALQAQLQTVRAENQQRENAILDQISKLTAISYDEPL